MRACDARADLLFDQGLQIADDGTADHRLVSRDGSYTVEIDHEAIARSKLRVETRLKMVEKLSPKKYGQKLNVEHSGSITLVDMSDEDLAAEMLELLTKGVVQLPAGAEVEVLDEPDAEDFSDLA